MRVKISFKNYSDIPVRNQKELNSYIHRCIGHDNKYHDSFSRYSISSIQGGKLDCKSGMLKFESEPYIYVSSPDSEFMQNLVMGAMTSGEKLFSMEFLKVEPAEQKVNEYYDTLITLSPILYKRKPDGRKITFDDPEWIGGLTEQCVKKIEHAGLSSNGFRIELRNPDKSKKKMIYVGDVFNPCSHVSLRVFGDKDARKYLYSVGLGNSCGSGFGSVKIYE